VAGYTVYLSTDESHFSKVQVHKVQPLVEQGRHYCAYAVRKKCV